MADEYQGKYILLKPVFLIGFMGAGKTSVAQYLANVLGLASIDADEYLELMEDRVIADIFAEDGEDFFRDIETRHLEELAKRKLVRLIATGGGVIKRPANIEIMHSYGYTVYLGVTADEAAERIPNTESRPLFKNIDVARKTVLERMPLYEAAADAYVETTGRKVPDICREVALRLIDSGVLVKVS